MFWEVVLTKLFLSFQFHRKFRNKMEFPRGKLVSSYDAQFSSKMVLKCCKMHLDFTTCICKDCPLQFARQNIHLVINPLSKSWKLYKMVDATIYHSSTFVTWWSFIWLLLLAGNDVSTVVQVSSLSGLILSWCTLVLQAVKVVLWPWNDKIKAVGFH